MTPLAFVLGLPVVVGLQTASEFSRSIDRHGHATASSHSAQEIGLVVLGVIVLVLTTVYTVRYFVRPGETGANHIKRRILDDDRLEPR
jgi:hypothetical protein